jgi:uncharacterized protein involved in exopolysaccharide biosynthesis
VSEAAPPTPIKPRRGLLIAMSVIFGVWVAFMLAMYFTTVYPQRHAAKPTTAIASPR